MSAVKPLDRLCPACWQPVGRKVGALIEPHLDSVLRAMCVGVDLPYETTLPNTYRQKGAA